MSILRFSLSGVITFALLLATVARGNPACSSHDAMNHEAPSSAVTHDDMQHGDSAPVAPCEDSGAAMDCCATMASCSPSVSMAETALTVTASFHRLARIVAPETPPLSRSRAPEPPPPKA